MTETLVIAVFGCDRASDAVVDLDWLVELCRTSGATHAEAGVDGLKRTLRVTFATPDDPRLVIARVQADLGGAWSLQDTVSYGTPAPGDQTDSRSRRSAGALAAVALGLALCVFAGFLPYDVDDSPLGYLLATLLLGIPLCLAAYLRAMLPGRQSASRPGYDIE